MTAAAEPPPGAAAAESTQPVDRALMDSARRRADLPVPAAGAPWSACAAPSRMLVVDADGAVFGCEYAACGPQRGKKDPLGRAWQSELLASVRKELAAGRLPLSHCSACAPWLLDELLAQAPPLRDYGAVLPAAEQAAPQTIVLRLPSGVSPLAAGLGAALAKTWPTLETLVVETDTIAGSAAFAGLLETMPKAAPRPKLVLRLRSIGAAAAARELLAAAAVAEIELTLADRGDAELAAARELADALGASLRARFVFTPAHWFQFEEAALGCAAHGVPLDLRVLDRGGAVPLSSLSVADLSFVKDVVVSTWSRCGTASRPASLGERAFDQLTAELRKLLRRRAEQEVRAGAAPADSVAPQLPPPDHEWCSDPARSGWWFANLFGHCHLAAVREWLLATVAGKHGPALVRRHAWMRSLCKRLACEQQIPALLELLRAVYGDAKGRTALTKADAAFAEQFDLRRYGGPWGQKLGLAAAPPRKRPFAIGKARAPRAAAGPPDVTVLIPSYRHADYIEETLRSVLAQTYSNFRVLVVDDGSPDETVAKARAIADPRLEVRENRTNLGLGNSVLAALGQIDTPYVALLNSDDLFHPERLQKCRAVLAEHPEVQLVTTGLSLVDAQGGQLTADNASLVLDGKQIFDWVNWFQRATPPADLAGDDLFPALLERNFLATSSNLVARTEWLRGQAEALQSLKYCLDWQLFLEAALEGALHHVHEPLVAYRLHATNTVWFREGRRWSYYLEVNRVAAEALRKFARRGNDRSEARVARVLEAMAAHIAVNRETDGLALFLNTAFDALQVDRLASTSARVQRLVQQLNTIAEQVREARDLAAARSGAEPARPNHRTLLGELAAEQGAIDRDARRWLQGYADSLEQRLRDCWSGRDRLEQSVQALRSKEAELERKGNELGAEVRRLTEQRNQLQQAEQALRASAGAAELRSQGLARDLVGVRADLEAARGAAAAVADLRDLITRELAAARAETDGLRTERDGLRTERDGLRTERDGLRTEREDLRLERERLRVEGQDLKVALAREQQALGLERNEIASLRQLHDSVAAELVGARVETEALMRDHEGLRQEHESLQRERDLLSREREALHVEWQRLVQQNQDLATSIAGHQQATQAAQHEAEALHNVRGQLDRDLAAARLQVENLQRSESKLLAEAEALRGERARLTQQGADLTAALARERQALTEVRSARDKLTADLAAMRDKLAADVAALRAEVQALQKERGQLTTQRQELAAALEREQSKVKTLTDGKASLERQKADLARDAAQLRAELDRVMKAREFRTGNLLWNKMPLGYLSRRGKKWYRRLVDAKNRSLMWGRGLARSRKAEGVAVVTACWQWPIYSHTFVYQEMIGLTHMGLDVKLFHWDLGDTAQMHKAFAYLADNRVQLQPIWENHLRDKEHFEKTRPGRLRSFLERIAAVTGKTVAELEKEPIVLQGCTFARMAELAGARYLHSYFFYDQSFMAMQAAWLLDLPRGVSCYADHMLDDYPWKLVPLHIELCGVVVATSARIKRELSAKSGGKYDDKIIVKPNGVDGGRFPPVPRVDRKKGDAFEVVSISRIEPKKGLLHLVEAVAELKQRGHKIVAHVVGSKDPHSKGSLEFADEFERRIAELGVQQEVILHGMKKQEELPPILQRCRAFVAPYVEMGSGDKDGIPTAMLEGLASGLPVITTDSGSILEVVTDGVEGFVVPQRDSKAFMTALERLIVDPPLERRMAKAARARFDREFDIRVTEKRLHERVARLVAANKPAR